MGANVVTAMFYFLVGLVVLVGTIGASALAGRWIAAEKGRSRAEGMFLGLFLGPLGILIETFLPDWMPPESDDPETKRAWMQEFERKERGWR